MREIAYAKLNLALHVRRRRADGYHELETLFAFCEAGDLLQLEPTSGTEPQLEVSGPFGAALAGVGDNLVLRAARMMMEAAASIRWKPAPDLFVPRFHLNKRLPVAAGLGGGSADAAAAARLLSQAYGLFDGKELALLLGSLGADIPACVASRTVIGRGTGTQLQAVAQDDLAGTPVLLVNPRVPLATGPVFRAWDGVDRGPLPEGGARAIALAGRNDLEAPARAIAPLIGKVLAALRAGEPLIARMSGSGATCFALFDDESARDRALRRIQAEHPDWWALATCLR
jgi:4-diphosphocytidyl-2-C-methyl-D-erythritol kinase